MRRRAALGAGLVAMLAPAARAHDAGRGSRLPSIGQVPDFVLTDQDRRTVDAAELRGKVLAVAFGYTLCPDTCPLLTMRMVEVQEALGAKFGPRVAFLTITVDPERDTPEVLREFAEAHGADFGGWAFLTGEAEEIRAVAHGFGVAVLPASGGTVGHTTLTSLVDRHGVIRVQYLGARFDPEEFRRDISGLLAEP